MKNNEEVPAEPSNAVHYVLLVGPEARRPEAAEVVTFADEQQARAAFVQRAAPPCGDSELGTTDKS